MLWLSNVTKELAMDFRSIPPQAPGTGSRVSSVVLPLPFNLQAPDLSGYGVRMLNLSTTPSAIAPRAMISPAAVPRHTVFLSLFQFCSRIRSS